MDVLVLHMPLLFWKCRKNYLVPFEFTYRGVFDKSKAIATHGFYRKPEPCDTKERKQKMPGTVNIYRQQHKKYG